MFLEGISQLRPLWCDRLSQPPVLDMKWENQNINVVEWPKISNFLPLLNRD